MDVPPVLYNLVFGESVLNDATAIVLFRTLEEFYETPLSWGTVPLMFWRFFVIATGSTVIGELLTNLVCLRNMLIITLLVLYQDAYYSMHCQGCSTFAWQALSFSVLSAFNTLNTG